MNGNAIERARVAGLRQVLVLVMLAAVGLLAGGCGFTSRWAAAGQQAAPPGSIEGRWVGTWHSEATGHSGGLRCIITDVTPESFNADFRATYGWLFSFGYQATMNVTGGNPATRPSYAYFAGEADLGALAGGVYTYDGKVGPREFFCTYRSKDDYGTFQLTRPGGAVGSRQ